jgi:hypothetical protein
MIAIICKPIQHLQAQVLALMIKRDLFNVQLATKSSIGRSTCRDTKGYILAPDHLLVSFLVVGSLFQDVITEILIKQFIHKYLKIKIKPVLNSTEHIRL